ncbi:MAG: class I SAM-dependent methyltransferase [Candidatus ainarchaeum sp.]|nr:class I SAM-dependent methyltransferase [Candidatus ainarchaeum sp.]
MLIDEDAEFRNVSCPGLRNWDVLEVGCGDGRLSVRLAGIAKTLACIDPDEAKLEKARERLRGSQNTRFEAGSGERLPFPDESFDAVFYSLSFHHLPIEKQYEGILEAGRVLRSNGKLFVYEPVAAGQMQSIFLLFVDELKDLEETQKTVQKAVDDRVFKPVKKKEFSIKWEFDGAGELMDFFGAEYGEGKVAANKQRILEILAGQADARPLVLEDRLVLVELEADG